MTDAMGMLQGVREPVGDANLLWEGVHHGRGAVDAACPLLGVTRWTLTLGQHLRLGHLWLLNHGLATASAAVTAPRCHHLKGDDGRQLLAAHGDVHGRHHGRMAVAHCWVGAAQLVGQQAEHVAAVAVFTHAHPRLLLLLLAQHVAHRGQDGPGRGAGQ